MKILQFRNVLLLLLLLVPDIVFGQDDLLYKNDSTILRVNIRSFDGNTVMYQIPGDTAGISHFISCSVLDSLRYSDGKSVDFTILRKTMKAGIKMTDRNYFSTELVNLLTGKPNLEYERISKTGKTGYVLGLLINYNLTESGLWENYPYLFQFINFSPYYFFVRTGINFYPFSQSLARPGITRTSTGFSLLVGSYRKIDYTTYYETGFKTIRVPAGSLMWNIKEKIFAGDHIVFTGAMEVSVIPFLIFFCPQIGVSVGF